MLTRSRLAVASTLALVVLLLPAPGEPSAVAAPVAATSASAADRSFAAVERRLDGPAGVVVFAVGAGARTRPLLEVGDLRTGVAWSTAKVPVTVAALQRSSSARTKARARAAITRSDNAAAEQLWRGLGRPTTAARRTQAVVRAAGDRRTRVQHRRVRAGFTAFGQTRWALEDQARFAAGLSCRKEARATLALMRKVVPAQSWGLGTLDEVAFKGGWGPVGRGYLVRQLAVVTLSDGRQVGVAIAVHAGSGFDRGTRDLTRITRWLEPRLDRLDGGRCPKR
ncbi:hypothetical protein SAMN04488543_1764 [Friedmanniella luteola]|uniref:Beta-lactamase enzyme family protein n=1 Tax=Friedmanniella luteola TaxID=546871 RepID=A0A1H1SCE0_9ACTN|nr:hypothetical protein [Friedmanniella luteola]SDS45601.1 hypothetical protein SAMN04488543_1764 [Friedmanniella luteola]